jgi:stage III sporulation protein AB
MIFYQKKRFGGNSMVKLMGCILIIAASTAAGFVLADRLKARSAQLKELQRAVLQLQNEIMFTRTALPEACLKVSAKSKQPIARIFNEIAERLLSNRNDSVYEAFSEVLAGLKEEITLNKTDVDVLLDLAKALGDADIDGHRKVFMLVEDGLKRSIDEAESLVAKNTKMYRYLGFSFGAVVAILLI